MTDSTDHGDKKPRAGIWTSILPLFIFLGIAWASYSLLSTEGRNVAALPSALIDKPTPQLTIPPLEGLVENGRQVPGMSPEIFRDKISIVNVFASWCGPCRQEHPYIIELGEDERVQVVGINHKDSTRNALGFLDELGNPYDFVGVDRAGRASIEWGVYGVPETFIVNGEGRIIFKHVGPISKRDLEERFKPIINDMLEGDANSTS